jgi:hypothetical protein
MISMVNEKGRPTDKQKAALRRFRISESEIEAMSFAQASSRLDELIGQARARKQGQQAGSAGGATSRSNSNGDSGSNSNSGSRSAASTATNDGLTMATTSMARASVPHPAASSSLPPLFSSSSSTRLPSTSVVVGGTPGEHKSYHDNLDSHSQHSVQEGEAYDVDQEMLDSKGFIEQHFSVDYAKGELVAEHSRQKFAIFMAKMIQKNKQSNMERINKD